MAGFEKTVKTPRAGRFPPPRRGPRRRSRLGLLTVLDARHLLARCEALDAVDARRLRQSRDRRPCLHDLASSTAVRLHDDVRVLPVVVRPSEWREEGFGNPVVQDIRCPEFEYRVNEVIQGVKYRTIEDVKDAVKVWTISLRKEFRVLKSSSKEYEVRCADRDCCKHLGPQGMFQ